MGGLAGRSVSQDCWRADAVLPGGPHTAVVDGWAGSGLVPDGRPL